VDFGAFLSGGIDSSSVVAVMSKHLTNPVKTFHIHFDESEFSELRYAEMVAKKYRTDHQNILIQPSAFLDEVIPAIEAIDHPSADGVNTYVVSKYTRAAGIKMALSGLGGDEVFAGYDVFKRLSQIQKLRGMGLLQLWEMLPMSLRSLPFLKGKMREILALERVDVASGYELFRQLFSKGELAMYGIQVSVDALWSFELEKNHLFAWIGNEEVERYMKPVLLRDTDQMSMAHSLEVRVPFLDHKLTDFVMGLPDQWKPIQPGKRLLIDAMGDDLPREIWDRKKMGFVFPWKRWVNQDLKSLVDEGLAVVAEIPSLSAIVADLRRTQIGEENPSWYKVWLLSTLGHWIKNNHIQCN
jgi:asparagine synthase (glutamine-hydrolysing)